METPPPGLTADDEADDDAGWSRAPRMAEKPNPESSSLRSEGDAGDAGMKGGKQRGKLWVFLLGYLISGLVGRVSKQTVETNKYKGGEKR